MTPVSEIAAQLAALRSGQLSLDAVAASFRRRRWRSNRIDGGRDFGGRADLQPDPGASVPDSIDEVTAAYDRGELTREQYRVLAHAVADAINAAGPGDAP